MDFVAEAFNGSPPASQALWVTDDLRSAAQETLQRDLQQLRIRYWHEESRSVWVLEEIGKDLPITTGVIVDAGSIETIRVLIFRESRGGEVRYPFFTDQFIGARLDNRRGLDRTIDGISGATLSVRALKHQAQLALFLAERIARDDAGK